MSGKWSGRGRYHDQGGQGRGRVRATIVYSYYGANTK